MDFHNTNRSCFLPFSLFFLVSEPGVQGDEPETRQRALPKLPKGVQCVDGPCSDTSMWWTVPGIKKQK